MTIREATRSLATPASWATSFALATMGAIALALISQVKIYLPGNPVPITLQVLGVILLGGVLGPRLAVAAVAEYLLMGLCGAPVFSGWSSGLAVMTGATGGYLFGFIGAAAACGAIYQRFATAAYARRIVGAACAGLVGVVIIYSAGWIWLACWGHMSLAKAFTWGVTPFIVADILKVSVAATGLALRRKGAA